MLLKPCPIGRWPKRRGERPSTRAALRNARDAWCC
jgi:hypothetical protein